MVVISLLIFGFVMTAGCVFGTSLFLDYYKNRETGLSGWGSLFRGSSTSSSGTSRYNDSSGNNTFSASRSDNSYGKLEREVNYINTFTDRDIPRGALDMLNNPENYDSVQFDILAHELERLREYKQANGEEERHN